MSGFLKAIGLSLTLVILIAILMILPAFLFGVLRQWQIAFLGLSYFVFFLATVWRTLRYGAFAKRSEDEQVKSISGRLALAVIIIGLVSVHWLAIYDFSQSQSLNSAVNIALNSISIFLIISSIVINQIAVITLGKFFDRLIIKPEQKLVTTGIYSQVRHPIYLSYILLFTSFCTLLHSIISLALLAVVCTIWFGNRIAIEEEMLVKEFDEEYKAYQQKTKKLFPLIY